MSKPAGLTIAVGSLLAVAAWATFPGEPPRPAVTPVQLEAQPLTIAASTVGDFGGDVRSWHLSVNSAGQAELTVDTVPEPTRRRFEVAPERLAEFSKALAEQRFFELGGEYGQHVWDGSTRSLCVTAGRHSKAVDVCYLMNWIHRDVGKLREPARAVRLLVLVRGWFDEPNAADLRKYDRMVLDAAK
jgi:hypothetical protein